MQVALEENQIVLQGLSINYVEGGQGTPMIFLHNGGGFWHSWEYQINYFLNNYKVYGIDWPGFGESESPKGLISLDLLNQVLSDFINFKKLKDVILVGNCIGGSAALMYAMNNPNAVSKLLLFNICPGSLIYPISIIRPIFPALNSFPRLKKGLGDFLAFCFTKTPLKRRFPAMLFGKKDWSQSDLYKRYVDKFKSSRQTDSRVNMVFSVHTFNITSYLQTGKIPNHILIWGEQNRVTPLKRHGYLHQQILKSPNFIILNNTGHLCMYEDPSKVNQIIETYINERTK
jgi:pimeloyl-ACP methyl ester carboxylesterase